MKAIQVILEGLKVVFISFVIALIVLFVDERNFLHVILSIPIVLFLLYILIEKNMAYLFKHGYATKEMKQAREETARSKKRLEELAEIEKEFAKSVEKAKKFMK
jgi:hypothetical protein